MSAEEKANVVAGVAFMAGFLGLCGVAFCIAPLCGAFMFFGGLMLFGALAMCGKDGSK